MMWLCDEKQQWLMWNGLFVEAWMHRRCGGAQQNVSNWTLKILFLLFFSLNSLQTELNNIFVLRKQLEEDVLANRNLQKVLEDQIKDIKNRQGVYIHVQPIPFLDLLAQKKTGFITVHLLGWEETFESRKRCEKLQLYIRKMIWGICNRLSLSNQGICRGSDFSFRTPNVSDSMVILLQWSFQAA